MTIVVAACAASPPAGGGTTFPPQTFGPGTSVSPAVDRTRGQVIGALRDAGLQVDEARVPFRPAESRRFVRAPRQVLQVLLPQDRRHGFISIYEFESAAAALAAGQEQAAYVGRGPGRVQFPPDSRFVVRHAGPTIVFYAWSPLNSPDPDTLAIEEALGQVGTEVEVPR